jgi:hypothetical protein
VEALEERMLMNNRFVVPGMIDDATRFSSLQAALDSPGLNAGDVIQIEPGSSPGHILNTDLPDVRNLTIRGDPAYSVQSIPYFFLDSAVVIGSTQQGFTLKNVELDTQGGTLQFDTDGTITGCRIQNDFAGTAIDLNGTSAAVITGSYFENANPMSNSSSLVTVEPAPASSNRITDNQFVAYTGTNITLLNYYGGTGTTDEVAHNSFVGDTGNQGALFDVQSTQGLAVQSNTFEDDSNGRAIQIGPPVQDLQVVDNVISLPIGGTGIAFFNPGIQTTSSSIVIANNHISTAGHGTGIDYVENNQKSTLVAKVEGNDLQGNQIGVGIYSAGVVAGFDLGGGPQGSMGANDFRGDPTAIYTSAFTAGGPIDAHMNVFGVDDPTTVIYDQHDNPALAAVIWSNRLGGNAAFVETLYLDFLHRTGDVNNPGDAGHWVTLLGQGAPAAAVVSDIARSPEGLGVAVDGLYHRFLSRDADAVGRANFVAYLQGGGTLEGVGRLMLASSEYQSRFPTDSSYVQSLYQNLLHRTGSTAEVNGWVAQLPQLGRAGLAQDSLLSQEYRADEVNDDYTHLLHRTPSTAEVNSWVSSGKDLLSIDTLFAASQEFQMEG